MGMYGFSNLKSNQNQKLHITRFQSPMGMYGFSNAGLAGSTPCSRSGFNPRWGCMVFQMEDVFPHLAVWQMFQSPMGMYGFSNFAGPHQPLTHQIVSIPDGDVWFFKSAPPCARPPAPGPVSIPDGDVWFFKCCVAPAGSAASGGFQSPMGMYGFSNHSHNRYPTQCVGFNPRWGCMVFQMLQRRHPRI